MQKEDKELQELKAKLEGITPTTVGTVEVDIRMYRKLLSTIEGLKGEVERLKGDVNWWHQTWEQERDLARGQKEHLHQQVERYRTALEWYANHEIHKFTDLGDIARKALEGSHETPIDTTRHGEDPMTGDRW